MTVWLGAYVGDNSTVNAEQQQWVLDALQIYGTDHVSGVTIGNECALFLRMLMFQTILATDDVFVTSHAGTS